MVIYYLVMKKYYIFGDIVLIFSNEEIWIIKFVFKFEYFLLLLYGVFYLRYGGKYSLEIVWLISFF